MTEDKTPDLFVCEMCGDCCKGYGGTYISTADASKIADFIGETTDDFISKYTTQSGNRLVISQKEDGLCVFFDKLCTIHPVKPEMCRRWPFIKSILVDVSNWKKMSGSCPGIRPDAKPEDIIARVKKELGRD